MNSFKRITMKTAGRLALVAALALGAAACAGDRALFPETAYSQVSNSEIELTAATTVFGDWHLPVGTKVEFEAVGFVQRIKKIKPAEDLTIFGITIPASSELEFVPVGNRTVMSAVMLASDVEYNGLAFKAKDRISFNEDGSVSEAFIAGKRTFDGKNYPAKTSLWFKDGEVTRSETQADRDRADAEHDREQKSCQAGCAPYSGETYANCMNHCAVL